MRLSPNFTLAELTRTDTGLPNDPPARVLTRLQRGAVEVLQPLRDQVGRLRVTSGYRSPKVNRAVGGASTSQHVDGSAADVIPLDVDRLEAWDRLLEMGIGFDQAIIYEAKPHIHISWPIDAERPPRRQALVALADGGYEPWDAYSGDLRPRQATESDSEPDSDADVDNHDHETEEATPMSRSVATMSAAIALEPVDRDALLTKALEQLQNAGSRALELFADGQISREDVEDVMMVIARGGALVGKMLSDALIGLPEPYETLSDKGISIAFDWIEERVSRLVRKVISWLDDLIGPNARRLLRRIDELQRDDLEDGIVGNDRSRLMYRLCRRIVKRFPASAAEGGVAFEGAQLILDGAPWGTPRQAA